MVQNTYVLRLTWGATEAEDVDPIVERDDHQILVGGQVLAIVEARVRIPDVESATVEPDQHGFGLPAHAFRPDVEREAVFALGFVLVLLGEVGYDVRFLARCSGQVDAFRRYGWTVRGEARGVEWFRRLEGLGRGKSQVSYWWFGIGNA